MSQHSHLVEEVLKNRKDFPEVANLVDTLRRQLGDVKEVCGTVCQFRSNSNRSLS